MDALAVLEVQVLKEQVASAHLFSVKLEARPLVVVKVTQLTASIFAVGILRDRSDQTQALLVELEDGAQINLRLIGTRGQGHEEGAEDHEAERVARLNLGYDQRQLDFQVNAPTHLILQLLLDLLAERLQLLIHRS